MNSIEITLLICIIIDIIFTVHEFNRLANQDLKILNLLLKNCTIIENLDERLEKLEDKENGK